MVNSSTLISGISAYDVPHQWVWELSVTDGENTATVGYPLTVEFNIVRNTFATANTATFNIYNLSPATRGLLDKNKNTASGLFFQDRFNTASNKILTFKAGYEGNLVTCFYGRIQEAYSHRQGTEVITAIQCMDLGIPTDYVNVTYDAGTTKKEAFKNIVQNATGLNLGAIGRLEGTYQTPVTFEGKILDVLNEISGGNTFIDNGVVNCLQPNECLDLGVTVLNAETGLINTPQRRGAEIIAEGIFNPNATVGQLFEVKSQTASEFSGTFILSGITHSGMISGAVAGTRTTKYNFLVGALLPSGKYAMTGTTERQPFSKVRGEDIQPVNGKVSSDVYSVYNYIKSHKGQPPNTRIGFTPYTWKNLLLPSGSENTLDEIYREINVNSLQNVKVITEMLYNFMQTHFAGKRVDITSNWRSIENNNSLSNASKESAHLRGAAIDFRVVGVPTQIAFKKFYNFWQGFTYKFQPVDKKGNKVGDLVIHVQSTLGKGNARRLNGQTV